MGATVFYASSSELATLTNTFSVAGTPTDPTTVSLAVTDPQGATTTYTLAGGTVTKTGTGVFAKDVPSALAGVWSYVWTGTGTASDVTAGTWTVQSAELSKLYCTVEEVKSRLGISASDTVDDFEIRLAVDSASRDVDDWCDRHFYRTAVARTFPIRSWYHVSTRDLISVTTLKTDASGDGTFETTWAASDFQLLPVDATYYAEQRPYTEIRAVGSQLFPLYSNNRLSRDDRVQIDGVYGWPAVPAKVKQAALILAAETVKLKDAPFGVAGFGEFGAVRVRDNPKAMALLKAYRRYPVLVG